MKLSEQVAQLINDDPSMMPMQIATQLGVSEFNVVVNLPAEMVTLVPQDQWQPLLAELPSWGTMTTIVTVAGCIFEFKGAFPHGSHGHGYYNLSAEGEGLHGHLRWDAITHVALVSKPFRGMDSHNIQFFDQSGAVIFKVYVGRDSQRVLLPQQVERFLQLRTEYAA